MRNILITFGLIGFFMSSTQNAQAQCSTPGSFTLNSPSSSNIYGTSINLTWGSSTNAVTYTVYYRVSGTSTWSTTSTTSTSKTISGLSYGTSYQIKIRAINFCAGPPPDYEPYEVTRDSNTRTVTTEPQTPTAYAGSSVGTNSFTASWTSRTGASSYDIDVSTSSSFNSFVSGYNGLNVSGTSETITDLASATTYYYRVRSVNSSGESSNSSYKTVYTLPDAPSLNEANSESQTSFVASWSSVTRADSYRLDVSTSNLFFSYVSGYQDLTVSGTSKTITGLEPGTTYYFRVRAYDNAGSTTSANSVVNSTITISDDPVANAASDITQTSFTVSWTAETGASSYKLDVSTSNSFSTYVAGYQDLSISTTSKSVTGLSTGTIYYYRVRSVNSSGTSPDSNVGETITIPNETVPGNATNLDQTSFTAHWGAVTGASGYKLDVSENSNFSSFVSGYENLDVSGTNQTVTGLITATRYYYRVRSYNTSGTSENSSSMDALTVPATPNSESASFISKESFTANWTSVSGATAYRLDISSSSDFSDFLPGYEDLIVSGTSESITGLDSSTPYYYRVRSENISGISTHSTSELVLTLPDTPDALEATSVSQDSFTAQWTLVSGANNYKLDLSKFSDFSVFELGYKNTTVNGNSKLITGLSSGTTYYYRVRSENATGSSVDSETIQVLTIPTETNALNPTNISETSFTAQWEQVTGVDNYVLDVSLQSDFSDMVPNYSNLSVSENSKVIEGLQEGSAYFYRVKTENTSGSSDYSNTIETITVPSAPLAQPATTISTEGFTAHWVSVDGVESYRLDVSTSEEFNSFVPGLEDFQVEGSMESQSVGGLSSGTQYFYRLRAQNISGTSSNTSTVSIITLPSASQIVGFSDHASTKFRVSWNAVSGVDTYEVFVATDPDFNNPVEGNNPLKVQHILTETFVEGLTPNTIYYVKVRSENASGNSEFSSIKTTSTANSDGSVVKPSINNFSLDDNAQSMSWNISGGTGGITSVLLKHKAIMDQNFITEELAISESGNYSIEVKPDWVGSLGMQYQVITEDLAGRSAETSIETYYVTIPDVEVEIEESFGTDYGSYQIISIPYELSTTRVEDLFEGILGNYDKSKWRLLKYRNDESGYIDYEEGLSVSNVQRGVGYWFISSEQVSLTFGSGQTPNNTLEEPFQLNLIKGWNQIGNPYLEDLSWSDILSANGNPESVGDLLTYDAGTVSFVQNDILEVFSGGFVFVDQDITLNIPVDINQNSSSGRVKASKSSSNNQAQSWEVNFTLRQGYKVNKLAGIGMNSFALEGKDSKDVLNPPYFSQYVSLRSSHDDFFYNSFAKDIVNLKENHHWSFELEASENKPIQIEWDQTELPQGTLVLYDIDANRIIDMHDQNGYTFYKSSQSFSIYYSNSYIDLGLVKELGYGYPNPMKAMVNIPHRFHIGSEPTQTLLRVFDTYGQEIFSTRSEDYIQGIRKISWNRTDNNGKSVPSGLYFYQIESSTKGQSSLLKGKIVVE